MWSHPAYAEQSNAGGVGQQQLVPLAPAGPLVPAQPAALAPLTGALDGAFDVPAALADRIELCKFLAAANLLPRPLQEAPANVLLIMHKALALQIPLSVAIEHLHVIDGKVGHSAELLRALLHRHGHRLRWITISDKEVEGELTLRHDPKNPRREKFTIADATRMELTAKANWKKDPASMMVARCSTRLVSRHCPEVAVALGNLSVIDAEDDPIVEAVAGEETGRDERAAQLLAEARAADTADKLKEIGGRAREAGLFDVEVEGGTLQEALLRRIQEISEARRASKETRADGGKP